MNDVFLTVLMLLYVAGASFTAFRVYMITETSDSFRKLLKDAPRLIAITAVVMAIIFWPVIVSTAIAKAQKRDKPTLW